jgi:RNA polymerase sigma factor (sigma-70 family)
MLQPSALLRHLRQLNRPATLPDRELLERFMATRDEAAFAELVGRHGALVLGVCRRTLRREQDAEDAFQAAFLVLARKAGSIRKSESLSSWLVGVAWRSAARLRVELAERRRHERNSVVDRSPDRAITVSEEPPDPSWREVQEALYEELARLPEKYRAPLVLCYLEGQAQCAAARQLGCSEGVLRGRLDRGRERLRQRLARRGITLSAALLTAALIPTGPVSAALVQTTARLVSGSANTLAATVANTVCRGLLMARLKIAVLILATAVVVSAFAYRLSAGGESPLAAEEQRADGQKPDTDRYGDPLPPGAVVRLGTVRFRVASVAMAFLPDGKTVVSAEQGGGIKLWDARSGRVVRELDTGHFAASGGGAGGFALTRDGKLLAVSGSIHGDDKPGWRPAAAVFDLTTGKAVRIIERLPLEGVHALTMSPEGKMLFTLDRNGKLRVEEVATGAELLTQKFPGDVMAYMTLSADGSMLALGSGPNTHKIFVWKWQTAEEPREIKSGWHRGREVAFSPDGKLLAECSDTEPDVRVFDVASGRLLHKLEQPDLEPYRHYHLAFSPNGKLLAAYGGTNDRSAVNLWDPATGKFVKRLDIGGALAFSPDSSLLVAGSRVWDFAAGKELSANEEAHRNAVACMVTAQNDLVATAGEDSSIRIWDARTGQHRRRLTFDTSTGLSIRAVALSPDGRLLVSSSMRDDAVYLWNVETGKRIYKLAGHGQLGSVSAAAVFLPDGKSFLTFGAADMCLRKWDVRTGKALAEHVIRPAGMPIPSEDDEPFAMEKRFVMIGHAGFTPDAKHLVFQANDTCYVFDAATGQYVRSFAGAGRMDIGMAISADSKLIASTAYGKTVQTKLPDGSVQSSSPKDHPVTLWNLSTGDVHKQITLPEQRPGPVTFSPDGKLFAVASADPGTRIRLMETSTGREVRKIEGFRGIVRSLAFMPDGNRLVSGMEDSSALVWDLTRER